MRIVVITAVWCPSCIVMRSRLEKIKKEAAWANFEEHDFDREKEFIQNLGVGRDIPVFIFFDEAGNEFLRLKGEIDRREFLKIIEENKNR